MASEPLIQKLFALERAVGKVSDATLRMMIIEAEEAALAMDREALARLRGEEAGLRAMTNEVLARDRAALRDSAATAASGETAPDDGFSIGFSQPYKKSA